MDFSSQYTCYIHRYIYTNGFLTCVTLCCDVSNFLHLFTCFTGKRLVDKIQNCWYRLSEDRHASYSTIILLYVPNTLRLNGKFLHHLFNLLIVYQLSASKLYEHHHNMQWVRLQRKKHATETRRTEEKSTRTTNTNTIYANVDYIELRWKRSTGIETKHHKTTCAQVKYLMEYWWIAVCELLKCYWLKAVLVSLVTFFRVKTLWNLIEMIWLVLLSVQCAQCTVHGAHITLANMHETIPF